MMIFTHILRFVFFPLEFSLTFFAGSIRGDPTRAIFVNNSIRYTCSFDRNVITVPLLSAWHVFTIIRNLMYSRKIDSSWRRVRFGGFPVIICATVLSHTAKYYRTVPGTYVMKTGTTYSYPVPVPIVPYLLYKILCPVYWSLDFFTFSLCRHCASSINK
jgi:hypothetical protein